MSSKQIHLGYKVKQSEFQKIIDKKFDIGETLIAIFKYNANAARPSFLLITNNRIINWVRGLMTSGDLISYSYNEIESISIQNNFFANLRGIILVVNKIGTQFKSGTQFFGMFRYDLEMAERIIKNQIDISKNSSQPVLIQNDLDPIKVLELRFVNGEISEEEFLKKKSILVGSNDNNMTKSSKICKGCGTDNEPEAIFCASCGISLV